MMAICGTCRYYSEIPDEPGVGYCGMLDTYNGDITESSEHCGKWKRIELNCPICKQECDMAEDYEDGHSCINCSNCSLILWRKTKRVEMGAVFSETDKELRDRWCKLG